MGLNDYRDEAGEFLKVIGASGESIETKISLLTQELLELKESVRAGEPLSHQVYDMLFILFEIAAQAKLDLESEWQSGRRWKNKKYLRK